eukprot:GILJ01004797.1.p1 GENE.GILJ01004797.1~~GILJ01004797.1.p1  ORF type:complete len:358 (-),score=41.16 GILJ01004797.1:255-1328(-)
MPPPFRILSSTPISLGISQCAWWAGKHDHFLCYTSVYDLRTGKVFLKSVDRRWNHWYDISRDESLCIACDELTISPIRRMRVMKWPSLEEVLVIDPPDIDKMLFMTFLDDSASSFVTASESRICVWETATGQLKEELSISSMVNSESAFCGRYCDSLDAERLFVWLIRGGEKWRFLATDLSSNRYVLIDDGDRTKSMGFEARFVSADSLLTRERCEGATLFSYSFVFWNTHTGERERTVPLQDRVDGFTMSVDRTIIITSATNSSSFKVRDMETFSVMRVLQAGSSTSGSSIVLFHPSQNLLVYGIVNYFICRIETAGTIWNRRRLLYVARLKSGEESSHPLALLPLPLFQQIVHYV